MIVVFLIMIVNDMIFCGMQCKAAHEEPTLRWNVDETIDKVPPLSPFLAHMYSRLSHQMTSYLGNERTKRSKREKAGKEEERSDDEDLEQTHQPASAKKIKVKVEKKEKGSDEDSDSSLVHVHNTHQDDNRYIKQG